MRVLRFAVESTGSKAAGLKAAGPPADCVAGGRVFSPAVPSSLRNGGQALRQPHDLHGFGAISECIFSARAIGQRDGIRVPGRARW